MKPIAEGSMGEKKNAKYREKTLDSERIEPKTQVNNTAVTSSK